jgi:enoyl-CoA hydratase/carnithine racemase
MSYETVIYEVADKVATITINRPEAMNSFTFRMMEEFAQLWHDIQFDDAIHAVVLRAAPGRAFCTGVDVNAVARGEPPPVNLDHIWHCNDPGEWLGPKSRQCWKPVIAAVHGMAAGGAFYWLNEADIVIASEDATFFDPHVTYGQAAVYEPMLLRQYISLGNVLRIALLGARERVSARTALDIGLITEVVTADELAAQAAWLGESIASVDPDVIAGTLRAAWAANDLGRLGATTMAPSILSTSINKDVMAAGNQAFENQPRIKPRIR